MAETSSQDRDAAGDVRGASPGLAPLWARVLRELSYGSMGLAIGLAFTVAATLNPMFAPPFTVLLGRTLFVALALTLVYHLAGLWRAPPVPRWVVQITAVALAAPLATLVMYLVSTGGDLSAFVGNPYRVSGFLWITGAALSIGVAVSLGALLRERDAQARAQALEFEVERQRLEAQASQARLALLSAQIEPHFLFNTLANVQALVEAGSPRAAEVLTSLIAYLRAALPRLHGQPVAPLGEELSLVRAYLELMHMRMPDRLQWSVQVSPELHAMPFAPMALLTLVENAVRHGIDPAEHGGRIEVGGARDASRGTLRLWVADTGVGLAETRTPGNGLTNLRARLKTLYGDDARLMLEAGAAGGTRATIELPSHARP